jgi:hypothetical protein
MTQEITIHKHELEYALLADKREFYSLGYAEEAKDGRCRIYIDRGSNVLGVAHLDTVVPAETMTLSGRYVMCPSLDDRLGVYALLYLLPQMGMTTDILLTDGEETGKSTAKGWKSPKQYHWGYEPDRNGGDVVLYQYEDDEIRKLLAASGFVIGRGSYSDIASLEDAMPEHPVKMFNVGVGYYQNHSIHSHADLDLFVEQMVKLVHFWEAHKDTTLKHEKKKHTSNVAGWGTQKYGKDYVRSNAQDYVRSTTALVGQNDLTAATRKTLNKIASQSRKQLWVVIKDHQRSGLIQRCSGCENWTLSSLMSLHGYCEECMEEIEAAADEAFVWDQDMITDFHTWIKDAYPVTYNAWEQNGRGKPLHVWCDVNYTAVVDAFFRAWDERYYSGEKTNVPRK